MFPAGSCREYFHRGFYKKHRHIPCAPYDLNVSQEHYEQAKREMEWIISHSDEYHFNILGFLLCKLNIPLPRNKKFFCSQFVAEILKRSDSLPLPKVPSLMRPMDYTRLTEAICLFRGSLRELVALRSGVVDAEEPTVSLPV